MSNFLNSYSFASGTDFTDGLISYWKLDEGADWVTASNAFTDSQSSHNGTATSVPDTATTNIDETAYTQTDGDLLNVDISSTSDFEFGAKATEEFSLSLWNKIDVFSTTYGAQFITSGTGTVFDYDWQFWIANDKTLRMTVKDTVGGDYIYAYTANIVDTGISVDDGNFHHYAMTYDGSLSEDGITLYVDGVSQTITLKGESGTYTGMADTGTKLAIGYPSWSTRTRSGWHDEYLVYDKELTQTEVTALFNQGDAGLPIY